MPNPWTDLRTNLIKIKQQGLYRQRNIIESAEGIRIKVQGKTLVNFCSNDYLGLAQDSDIKKAFQRAIDHYGVGSGSAHLVSGHHYVHQSLEEALAAFTGRERALVFSTGYMANLGVITALMGKGDAVFEDRLNHASLIDGGLHSGALFKRFRHGDIEHLEQRLTVSKASRKLIVSDGIFSMDGDAAPLKELAETARCHDAYLMVDDAHGLGVLGKEGKGTLQSQRCSVDDVPILMGTFGKAFGTFGAFIAGAEVLIETLLQTARTYIYTTALPPALAVATETSLVKVIHEDWRREKLQLLINQFRAGASQLGLAVTDSCSPIQPIVVQDCMKAVKMSEALQQQGFFVAAIRPPTVPVNSSRLRITLSALHQESDVNQLLDALDQANLQA